ncbi:MAG: hypothetical protein EBT04_14260, partial [Betaproteobacteria bacterium]|nr:hypothetical protein [Betaproteobacteria bacterium]
MLTSIELVNVSSTTGSSVLDLVNAPAVTAISSSASAGALTLNNIQSTAATIIIASGSSVHTVDYANNVVSGSTDTAKVSLSNFSATANGVEDLVIDTGIETLALTVTGTNSADTTFAGAITVGGSGTLTLTAGAGTVASNLILATTVDASALTGALTILGVSDAAHTLTGGSGNDSLKGAGAVANTLFGNGGNDTLTGGSGNDIVSGGDGNDSITAGSGNDNLSGGAGSDTFVMAANLTADDTIAGGDGSDTVSATGTVGDTFFTNLSSIETLKSAGSVFIATLGAPASTAGVTTVDLSNVGPDQVTFASGYSGAATVRLTGDSTNSDKVTNSANIALTVVGNASDLDAATTITGGTGTDTITLTADNDGTGAMTTLITGIENIIVAPNATTASNKIVITMGANDLQ